MKNKKIRCYVYIRVSTTMQVDGYSLMLREINCENMQSIRTWRLYRNLRMKENPAKV